MILLLKYKNNFILNIQFYLYYRESMIDKNILTNFNEN